MAYSASNHWYHRPKLLDPTDHHGHAQQVQRSQLGYNPPNQPVPRSGRHYDKDGAHNVNFGGPAELMSMASRDLKVEPPARRQAASGATANSIIGQVRRLPSAARDQTIEAVSSSHGKPSSLDKRTAPGRHVRGDSTSTIQWKNNGAKGHNKQRAKSGTLPNSAKVVSATRQDMPKHRVKSKTSRSKWAAHEESRLIATGTLGQPVLKGQPQGNCHQAQKQKIASRLLMHDRKYNSHIFNELAAQEEQLKALDSFKNSIHRQNSEVSVSHQQVAYTRNASSVHQTTSILVTEQSRAGAHRALDKIEKPATATREQSRASSNTSGHRRSSLTSGNKSLMHPTPSQQLNQKNKLIERSRANCIKNLQRLIEQRSHVAGTNSGPQGKKALNRTAELKRDSLNLAKLHRQNRNKPSSAFLCNNEDLSTIIHKPSNKKPQTVRQHGAAPSRAHIGRQVVSFNETGHEKELNTPWADPRDRMASSLTADLGHQAQRNLHFDSKQNIAKQALVSQNSHVPQPNVLSTRSMMQSVSSQMPHFGSILTARDLNSTKRCGHRQQDAAILSEQRHSRHSSSPVTQGFISTRNSNDVSVISDNCQNKENNQNINELNQEKKQRFIQPLRAMKTKNSKMIDLNRSMQGQRPIATGTARQAKASVAAGCLQKAKIAARTVHLEFPRSCMANTGKNQSSCALSGRPKQEARPPAKYQVNSLKTQIFNNNFKKKKNKNDKVDQILQNVMTVQRNSGSDDGKTPFPSGVYSQQTVQMAQASITSDYIGYDQELQSQYMHAKSHIQNLAAKGDNDHSPQQLTGFTNSHQKQHQQSSEDNTEGGMQTSQSWSQMQSVSSDSHNKMNKHIRSINGQNFLPEYNNLCYRSLLEPRIIAAQLQTNESQHPSDEARDAAKANENPTLRALVSRNKYNLNHMSLQGSLTDIQAAPSIMEVDVTVASQARVQAAAQRASFRSSAANGNAINQVAGTPTISYGLGMANGPTTENTTGQKECKYIGSNMSNEDRAEASSPAKGQASQHSKEVDQDHYILNDQKDSPGFAHANKQEQEPSIEFADQISYSKHATDDDDLCQIDKITTERSQQSTRQERWKDRIVDEDEPQILNKEEDRLDCMTAKESQMYQGTDERLLNLNRVLMAEQQNTGATETSLVKDEALDQVEDEMVGVPQHPAPPDGSLEPAFHKTAQQNPCSSNMDAEFIDTSNQIYNQHFQQTLNIMRNLQLLQPYSESYKSLGRVVLPEPTDEQKSHWPENRVKVIFFDIDETMIHCIDDRDSPDMKGQVPLVVSLQEQTENSCDDTPTQSIHIQINLRPGLRECLLDLSKSFQLISFTASDQSYADTILDHIDPTREIFLARLYRQHCVDTQYGLIKDLRIIANSDLRDLILVDNSALSFAFNVNNGIPILPFFDDEQDEELKHLNYYLNCIRDAKVDDVRHHNDDAFGLLRLQQPSGQGDQAMQSSEAAVTQEETMGHWNREEGESKLAGGAERMENSGEYVIRDDEISNHHAMSKDYLQCDPIEMTEDRMNKQQIHVDAAHGTNEYGMNYVDQPISLLNLLNTNQVIEERSNEDEGQTSSPHSPSLPVSSKSRQHTREELSIGQPQLSQLQRASYSKSAKDQSIANRQSGCPPTSGDPDGLPYVDQSQIFEQAVREDLSRASSSNLLAAQTQSGDDG